MDLVESSHTKVSSFQKEGFNSSNQFMWLIWAFVVTEVQHKDICYQRRGLYIVIIKEEEEEAGSPRRCGTLTASDTRDPSSA